MSSQQETHQINAEVQLAHYCREMLDTIGKCVIDDRPRRFEPKWNCYGDFTCLAFKAEVSASIRKLPKLPRLL
jgi:hypothetical protein